MVTSCSVVCACLYVCIQVSYRDILNADVVIVSVQFILTNKYFRKIPAGRAAASQLYFLAQKPGQC